MSTASRNCRNHVQRLRAGGGNAPQASGSRGLDPWILRSARLRWLNNPSGKHQTPCDLGLCKNDPQAKTAASLNLRERFSEKGARGGQALSLTILNSTLFSICRLEARAGTSPPPSLLKIERRPP